VIVVDVDHRQRYAAAPRFLGEASSRHGRAAEAQQSPLYGALAADAAPAPDGGVGIPGGADAIASGGVPGALATTDAEGSEGSEAGDAKPLAGAAAAEGAAASWGVFEQAASVRSNADDKTSGANFMESAFKVLYGTPRLSCARHRSLGQDRPRAVGHVLLLLEARAITPCPRRP
jgi:hypothetical protein